MNPHMLLFRYAMTRRGEMALPHRDGAPVGPVTSNVEAQRQADRYAAQFPGRAEGGTVMVPER